MNDKSKIQVILEEFKNTPEIPGLMERIYEFERVRAENDAELRKLGWGKLKLEVKSVEDLEAIYGKETAEVLMSDFDLTAFVKKAQESKENGDEDYNR